MRSILFTLGIVLLVLAAIFFFPTMNNPLVLAVVGILCLVIALYLGGRNVI